MNPKRILIIAVIAAVVVGNLLLARDENPVDAAWRIAGEHGYTAQSHYLKSADYHFGLLGGRCTVELRSRADVPGLDPDPRTVHRQVEPAHSPRGARVTIERSSGLANWRLSTLEPVDLTAEAQDDEAVDSGD
ncbi:MAG: hypothetical protein ACYS26_01975 [Planctomycetota bacterium]